jgi:hypothetical protein
MTVRIILVLVEWQRQMTFTLPKTQWTQIHFQNSGWKRSGFKRKSMIYDKYNYVKW